MSLPLFVVENVSYGYPGHPVCLDGVSFSVSSGERVALLGCNGSGKSTLLHLLNGLYFPMSGEIKVMGVRLAESELERAPFGQRFRKEVGFLFQNSDVQLFCPTVEEELAFGPLQLGWSHGDVARRIDDTLGMLEISALRHRVPQSLSGGEKKRVALASLLVMSPSVLLLDEPTSGLDPRSQSLVLDILEHLRGVGMTLITATHDLVLVPHIADRVVVLAEDHRVAADAAVDAALADLDLLTRVNLIHVHSHKHGRLVHQHPHSHPGHHH